MDKSLKVGEDEWKEMERGGHEIYASNRSEHCSVISQMIKVQKMHTQGLHL